MKRLMWLLLLSSLLVGSAQAARQDAHARAERRELAAAGDEKFLYAREAFKNGERTRLNRLAGALAGHELQPWAEYWWLKMGLEQDDVEGVGEFLERQRGSYVAERLRLDWIKVLGKRQDWARVAEEMPRLEQPDQEAQCYGLQARLQVYKEAAAVAEVLPFWFGASELAEACLPLIDALVAEKRLGVDDVWERVRRLLETRKLGAARQAIGYLPAGQRPDGATLESVADKPARHLARLSDNFGSSRVAREMALFAVQRMARQDPAVAAAQWRGIEKKFSDAERGYAWGQLAWQGAMRHLPEALAWFESAGNAPLSEEQLAWKVRAALRAHDWPMVARAVGQMPAKMAADPAWIYWRARAAAAQGRGDEARALYLRLSGQPSFYGNLADDELGRPISVPPRSEPPSDDELLQAKATPGLRRALALFRLDMRIEGVREWNWTLRGMDDRRLLAAAELARRNEIFDRAINTADKTLVQHDYGLRYLAPFREYVDPKARELALDNGWVYGLMRQESRFIMSAKSSAGAKGLMQLMPATARWVAKKIGLAHFEQAKVADMEVNVTLGTNYMKMVLDSLDNHPVLASAAYNAGPGRARKWRAERPLEGAIYAETIPFNETRDYVKKVMSNAVYYSALFEDKPQSLKPRLGVVQPARATEGRGEDLP